MGGCGIRALLFLLNPHAISSQRSAGKLAGTKNVLLVEAECPHVP